MVRSKTIGIDLAEPTDKSMEIMRKFSEQYARRSDTYFCVDKGVTSVVIKVSLDYFWICIFKVEEEVICAFFKSNEK